MDSSNGPDFSHLDSKEKVAAAFRNGDLEKLFLFPLEFGGQDIELNVLFVPLGLADVKAGIDCNIIRPLVAEGEVTQYKAEPEYHGNSFVPISLKITAWDPGNFSATINMWGPALSREQDS